MRYQGKITTWKDDQGFGFITPNGGGKDIFIHVKSFANSRKRPVGNELVSYQISTDAKGRLNAAEVHYVGDFEDKPVTIGKSVFPVYFALTFLVLMCLAAFLGSLPLFVLVIYAATSLLTFILYWADKRAAENRTQRTPESTLQLLSLVGGWPGGLFAQRIFRHKSTKKSFQFVYWLTVFLNITILFVVTSPSGRRIFKALLGI
jgi:uncharacterized membrane protein YsdA (DUF1294 family)/cold shock CspA family protein